MTHFSLQIGIYAVSAISFTGATPHERDLGGAEYCTVALAEALAKRGHNVSVFVKDSEEHFRGGTHVTINEVTYFAAEKTWRDVNHATQWDVFISSRDYAVLSNTVLTAKLIVLWNHDTLGDPDALREHLYRMDKIFCLSDYHKEQFLRTLTDPITNKCTLKPEHISLTRNGIDQELIDVVSRINLPGCQQGKYSHPTFVYCSRPERGLLYLLRDIWPQIIERIHDARLKVACYDVSAELLPDPIRVIHHQVYDLLRTTPNVDFLGGLRRLDLFPIVSASWALLYPGIHPEVSCLGLLEAQALGTPGLTSNRGALPESNWTEEHVIFDWERVEVGDREHAAQCADWITGFIQHYWDEGEVRERQAVQAEIQEHHSWDKIAMEWEQAFYQHFQDRSTTKAKRVIQNLIYHSDLLAARAALDNGLWLNGSVQSTLTGPASVTLVEEVNSYLTYHHVDPEAYNVGEVDDNLLSCPGRMKVALDLIEQKFGHAQPFRLLDVGVGNGRFLYHVLRNFHNCQVMGIDFSLELCMRARKNLSDAFPSVGEDISFIQHGDIIEWPYPSEDQQADVVVAGEWLEHQIELLKAMQTVDAWCREGGLVIYTTPYGPWEACSFGDQKTKDGHDIRAHVSHFEYRDLQEMFREVNHRIEAVYMQHSPIDNSILGQYVLSYEKQVREKHYPAQSQRYAGQEMVVRYDPPQFYPPDYERKFMTTRPYIRVGGFLITKDEEDNITRALKPLVRRIDHILVYDTGSQDRTTDLAYEYCHQIVEGYWDNDFGAARNRALDELLKHDVDWVLWLDADEILSHGAKLRHYLSGDLGVFPGLILLQQHLMVDSPITQDIPIRLFRNKSNSRFFGKIHEHCMDLNDPTGNTNLHPLMILPDVKIIHFGYATEDERRWKAIYRNYDLLKLDREAYPEREMGKLFLMRDYLHHVKWSHLEKRQPLMAKDIELLYAVITMYEEFAQPNAQNGVLARFFHDQAAEILGKAHLPGPYGIVPVHTATVLGAINGPLPETEFRPQFRWFTRVMDIEAYLQREVQLLCERLRKTRHVFED